MTKTAAQKQAAYRQRKSDKVSEESAAEGSALSPGADCVPGEDTEIPLEESTTPLTEDEEVSLARPLVTDWNAIIKKLDAQMVMVDTMLGLLLEIHQHITHPLLEVPPQAPFRFHSSFNETRPDEDIPEPPSKPAPKPVGDLTQCMRCEKELPPTETPRRVRELCHECTWRN